MPDLDDVMRKRGAGFATLREAARRKREAEAADKAEEPESEADDKAEKAPTGERKRLRELLCPVAPEWMVEEPPPRRYLLEWVAGGGEPRGLFPRGKVGLLAAPGGVGKSFALIDLAVALATGRRWLGAFPVDHDNAGGRVLLAMGEEDPDELRRRLWAVMRAHDLNAEERAAVASRVWLLPLAGVPCALTPDDRGKGAGKDIRTLFAVALEDELRAMVAEEPAGWAALLLDPVSRFAGADAENDNGEATRFVQVLERLTQIPGGPSILAAVHTNKGSRKAGNDAATSAEAVRGSSAFVDGARWVAAMAPALGEDGAADPGRVWLGVAKSNYGPRPGAPWLLSRSTGGALVALSPGERGEALAAEQSTNPATGGAGLSQKQRDEREETARMNALTRRLAEVRRKQASLAEMDPEAAKPLKAVLMRELVATLADLQKERAKADRKAEMGGGQRDDAPRGGS